MALSHCQCYSLKKENSLTKSNLEAVFIQVSPGKKLYTGCSLLTSLTLHV